MYMGRFINVGVVDFVKKGVLYPALVKMEFYYCFNLGIRATDWLAHAPAGTVRINSVWLAVTGDSLRQLSCQKLRYPVLMEKSNSSYVITKKRRKSVVRNRSKLTWATNAKKLKCVKTVSSPKKSKYL